MSDYLGPEDHIDWSTLAEPVEPQFHYDAESAVAAGPRPPRIWIGQCPNPGHSAEWHGMPQASCPGSHLFEECT